MLWHKRTAIRADGFIDRTADLLFVNFQEEDAYLIAILDHKGWTKLDLVTTSVHNWPNAGIFTALRGPIALAQPVADADRVRLRNAGVTTMLEVDGTIYCPAGQSTAGTPIAATVHSNNAMNALRELREVLRDRPNELASGESTESGFRCPRRGDLESWLRRRMVRPSRGALGCIRALHPDPGVSGQWPVAHSRSQHPGADHLIPLAGHRRRSK